MICRKQIFILIGIFAQFIFSSQTGYADFFENGRKVIPKETAFDRFEKSFEEADYVKLNQDERAMAVRNALLSTFIQSDDPKEALTPEQMRKKQTFLNQHFYWTADETRSAIFKDTLPIIALIGDQQALEKAFAEASRSSPQEAGKLMCAQLQYLESSVPRAFGQLGKKIPQEDLGNLNPVTEKYSGLVQKNAGIANYECKLVSFDEPVKVSQFLSVVDQSYRKQKGSEKKETQQAQQLGQQNLKFETDCTEFKVKTLVTKIISSFSKKSASGKLSQGYYMGSEEGCRLYGFVSHKNGEFQLYLNSANSRDVKPIIFKDEKDAVPQLKFLWANLPIRPIPPSRTSDQPKPKGEGSRGADSEGSAWANPLRPY
jgi:hypothetical protein